MHFAYLLGSSLMQDISHVSICNSVAFEHSRLYCGSLFNYLSTLSDAMLSIYEPLALPSGDGCDMTRVLQIVPASSHNQPICCTLATISLGNAVPYSAVSYVWGDPVSTKTILMHGAALSVRSNIWNFLQQMRSTIESITGYLWIDAICINQEDISERGQQVAIMGQIYSQAEFVYVWLGSGSQKIEQLIRDLNGFDWPSKVEQ
jgi:hypothetical protein